MSGGSGLRGMLRAERLRRWTVRGNPQAGTHQGRLLSGSDPNPSGEGCDEGRGFGADSRQLKRLICHCPPTSSPTNSLYSSVLLLPPPCTSPFPSTISSLPSLLTPNSLRFCYFQPSSAGPTSRSLKPPDLLHVPPVLSTSLRLSRLNPSTSPSKGLTSLQRSSRPYPPVLRPPLRP